MVLSKEYQKSMTFHTKIASKNPVEYTAVAAVRSGVSFFNMRILDDAVCHLYALPSSP